MHRDPHLRRLSSDHHHALVLARVARRGAESGEVVGTWRTTRQDFAAHIEPHMRIEEELLVPALKAAGRADLAAQIVEDHGVLRGLVAIAEASPVVMTRFADELDRHVRYEERDVFPVAQQVVPMPELEAIDAASARPYARATDPPWR